MLRLISIRLRLGLLVTLALAALPCFSAEVAVLRNGFSIRHERREIVGDVTRLYVSADGSSFVDVPTAEIEHFEAAPDFPASSSQLSASGVVSQSHPSTSSGQAFSQRMREMGHPERRLASPRVRSI